MRGNGPRLRASIVRMAYAAGKPYRYDTTAPSPGGSGSVSVPFLTDTLDHTRSSWADETEPFSPPRPLCSGSDSAASPDNTRRAGSRRRCRPAVGARILAHPPFRPRRWFSNRPGLQRRQLGIGDTQFHLQHDMVAARPAAPYRCRGGRRNHRSAGKLPFRPSTAR